MGVVTIWSDPALPQPEALAQGRDLVLEVPVGAWAGATPLGTLLDDFLTVQSRHRVDADARALASGFRDRIAGLVVEGADLAGIWATELLATVFFPAALVRAALPPALERLRPTSLDVSHVSVPIGELIGAVARDHGVRVERTAVGGSPIPVAPSTARARARRWAASLGLPARVTGDVVCLPYWNLEPVVADLLTRSSHPPVAWPVLLPGTARVKAAGLVRGGWVGWPGRNSRLHSRKVVSRALDEVVQRQRLEPHDAAAVGMLRRRGLEAVAEFHHARAALGSRTARLLLVPWDSPALPQTFLAAARETGTPSLILQHGFDSLLGDTDKLHADYAAVWSAEDQRTLVERGRRVTTVSVTGNPAADDAARPLTPRSPTRSVLVLPEYPSRLSQTIDARISFRHVACAVGSVRAALPGWTIVIRPHPGDTTPEIYLEHFAGRDVRVDTVSPIGRLIEQSTMCVGALSTAALQAVTRGVPTVFLDLAGVPRPGPFGDAADGLPVARSEEDLRDALLALRDVTAPPGEESCRRALGMRSDARDAVLALIEELSAGQA